MNGKEVVSLVTLLWVSSGKRNTAATTAPLIAGSMGRVNGYGQTLSGADYGADLFPEHEKPRQKHPVLSQVEMCSYGASTYVPFEPPLVGHHPIRSGFAAVMI